MSESGLGWPTAPAPAPAEGRSAHPAASEEEVAEVEHAPSVDSGGPGTHTPSESASSPTGLGWPIGGDGLHPPQPPEESR